MKDYAIRATAAEGLIRAFVAKTTDLAGQARKLHNTYPTATAALGRLLTAAGILGLTLKGDDILTVRINGDGPLGPLVAVAKSNGKVKGYVRETKIHLPLRPDGKLDVGKAVGHQGMLYISKDLSLKEPYTGSVPLVNGEIAEDLARYFAVSEQTPAAVALGVLVETDNSVRASGGLIVQLLPGADTNLGKKLEADLAGFSSISSLVDAGCSPEEILKEVFSDFNWKIHLRQSLKYECDCSRQRLEKVLISLGVKELQSLAAEEKGAELRCHFCNVAYRFSEEDLNSLLQELG